MLIKKINLLLLILHFICNSSDKRHQKPHHEITSSEIKEGLDTGLRVLIFVQQHRHIVLNILGQKSLSEHDKDILKKAGLTKEQILQIDGSRPRL